MTTTDLVRFATFERAPRAIIDLPAITPSYHQLVSPVRSAIVCARRCLLGQQQSDGHWLGYQVGDASLPSQLLMLLAYAGREATELADQAANSILRDQSADGGWPAFPGGTANVSVSVQAYLALKLAGQKANRSHMVAARQMIRQLGGADAADATTRCFLALFGQIDHAMCESSAPELFSLPSCSPRSINLSRGVRELFVTQPTQWPATPPLPLKPSQFLSFVWKTIAELAASGDELPVLSPTMEESLRQFVVVDHDRDEARPCLGMSPAVDSAMACEALIRSGIRAERFTFGFPQSWLNLANQDTVQLATVLRPLAAYDRGPGDDPALPPEIQMLDDRHPKRRLRRDDEAASDKAADEKIQAIFGVLLQRQNLDGGWSIDACPNAESESAATAAVLEAISLSDISSERGEIRRGIEYLRATQRADGSWDSATGARFIHGTSRAVRALMAADVSASDPAIEAGVNWLLVHQQESGGWGEMPSASNPSDNTLTAAASAIQTAWAVSALVAAGLATDDATLLGVQFLVDTQEDDGQWQDTQFILRDPATANWYRSDLRSAAESLATLADWAVGAANAHKGAGRTELNLCTV
jgi:hypothetical protein